MDDKDAVLENLKKALFNTHLIIPLRYENENNSFFRVTKNVENSVFGFKQYLVNGTDLHEITNSLFSEDDDGHILCAYSIDEVDFLDCCFNSQNCRLFVDDKSLDENNRWFSINKVLLYVFNNGIAFICLSFEYSSITTMRKIYDPSYVKLKQNKKCKYVIDGVSREFSFEFIIKKIIERTGLKLFFDREELIFSDAYAMSVAVIPKK